MSTNNADWLQPLSLPRRDRVSTIAGLAGPTPPPRFWGDFSYAQFTADFSGGQPITADRWAQPASQPVPARARAPDSQVSAPVYNTVEPVTADRWAQPPSQPTLRPPGTPATGRTDPPRYWLDFTADFTSDFQGGTPPPQVWWQQPASLPTLARGLAAASLTVSGVLAEAVTLDTWFQAPALPLFRGARGPADYRTDPARFWLDFTSDFTSDFLGGAVPPAVWWIQPPGQPLLRAPAVAQSQLAAPVSTAPETVTAERWAQPASLPVLPKVPAPASQMVEPVSIAPETVSADRWAQPPSRPMVRLAGLQSVGQVQPLAEGVTADRWMQPASLPTQARALYAGSLTISGVLAETVTLDKWNQGPPPPLFRGVRSSGDYRVDPARFWLDFTSDFTSDFQGGVTPPPVWWIQPPGQPLLRAPAVPATQIVAPVSLLPESVTAERWAQPPSQPVLRPVPTPASQIAAPVSTAAEAVSTDRWAQPPSQPTRRPVRAPDSQYAAPVSLLPEAVTAERWAQPASLPVLRKPQAAASQMAAPVSIAPETVTADRWAQAAGQPLRPAPAPQIAGAVFVPAEAVTSDRWFQPAGLPQRLPPVLQTAGPVLVAAETVTADRWIQPTSVPQRRSAAQPPLALVQVLLPLTAESITLDKWFQPASQPARRSAGGSGVDRVDPARFWQDFTADFTSDFQGGVVLPAVWWMQPPSSPQPAANPSFSARQAGATGPMLVTGASRSGFGPYLILLG